MGILRVFRLLRRVVGVLLVAAVLSLGGTAAWVVAQGLHDDRGPTDAILVMGAAQFDGDPSPVLRNRLRYAYALYSTDVAPRIITVGGKRPGDRYTEAAAGRNFLHSLGVPYADLRPVPEGTDTYSSMQAVARWASKQGIKAITVVTDRCHEARAVAMLRSLGFVVHGVSPASGPGSSITWSYVARETAGLLRFWLVNDTGVLPTGRIAS
jgi:uncharacterized SAM-binding protein YcdF (DUF218 family)